MAVITGLCDQDHRACFGCEVSHSEITRIEQQLAKLTDPLLAERRAANDRRGLYSRAVFYAAFFVPAFTLAHRAR